MVNYNFSNGVKLLVSLKENVVIQSKTVYS